MHCNTASGNFAIAHNENFVEMKNKRILDSRLDGDELLVIQEQRRFQSTSLTGI